MYSVYLGDFKDGARSATGFYSGSYTDQGDDTLFGSATFEIAEDASDLLEGDAIDDAIDDAPPSPRPRTRCAAAAATGPNDSA